jgi:hypothetical protein
MGAVDEDHKAMEHGIKALLGKESYGPAVVMPEPCAHISDGFVYYENAIVVLLQCVKCHVQFEVVKGTRNLL